MPEPYHEDGWCTYTRGLGISSISSSFVHLICTIIITVILIVISGTRPTKAYMTLLLPACTAVVLIMTVQPRLYILQCRALPLRLIHVLLLLVVAVLHLTVVTASVNSVSHMCD